MKRYKPSDIEPKWQKTWAEQKIYEATEDPSKPKKYILEFFPYPSGAAMHVGHVRNYTIGDVLSRFYRMTGHNVLHPMGWDAFGLPAENYAIKTGISPQKAVADNVEHFKQQLTQMGFGYDWSREINSTDPAYYKWTQWFFSLLLKKGLAYQKESLQWWCPFDKTVLANEQVEAGRCWRCGNVVEKKSLNQWFFKITDYADRLVEDLDDLDWSEAIKAMQRNWIGKSIGAEIDFKIDGNEGAIKVFTTRPDTLFGATFMVLAPEHPMVQKVTTDKQKLHIEKYIKQTQSKSDVERQETDREKTGEFTGAYVINPVTNEKIPVWISDYVLMGYGTGAIMAVPAHDDRDREFAKKFDLPIVEVIEPETGTPQQDPEFRRSIVAVVYDRKNDAYLSINWGSLGGNLFIGGGRDESEDIRGCALREIREETGYKNIAFVGQTGPIHHNYFAASKNVARRIEAHGLLFELVNDERDDTALEPDEAGKFTTEWIKTPEVEARIKDELHTTVFRLLVKEESFSGEGIMTNSGVYNGMSSAEAREKIVADLTQKGEGAEKVNYKIRDWLISRQRYWGAPIPIIHCSEHGAVPVPDDQLPVTLPEIKSYEPTGEGTSVLAGVKEWVDVACPICGKPAKRETDTMDGFACSSWYFLRFADPHNDKKPFSREKADFWLPVDMYIGGAEHAVMHLLYARMWTKVMYDEGLIDFKEPFLSLKNQGMIAAPDGRKMSKSYGNVIAPDELIADGYGADTIRVMELFIGPWNQGVNWSTEGMGGCYRFLQRVWTLVHEAESAPSDEKTTIAIDKEVLPLIKVINVTAKKVTEDLHHLGFNTAIASLMECVNELYKIKRSIQFDRAAHHWRWAIETLLRLLAPFAPHISEELWHDLGHTDSIHTDHWPQWDEKYLKSQTLTLAVQVNGKVRAEISVPADATEEDITSAALQDPKVQAYVGDKKPAKVIYVPGRLVSVVV